MDVTEPRVRRRGLFLTPHDPDSDSVENLEHDTSEGVVIRVRIRRRPRVRLTGSSPSHRQHTIKSATATDTRRRLRSRH